MHWCGGGVTRGKDIGGLLFAIIENMVGSVGYAMVVNVVASQLGFWQAICDFKD